MVGVARAVLPPHVHARDDEMTRKPQNSHHTPARRRGCQFKIWFTNDERARVRAHARQHDEKISTYVRRALGLDIVRPGPRSKSAPLQVRRLHKK